MEKIKILEQENSVLKEQLERNHKANLELKEQLQEQIDYKEEYYHYWQQTKKELAIKEKAFELCRKEFEELYLQITDMIFDSETYFIEQAKESMK